ncbi:MAG: signal peptide peptidase SppA [Anaerolineales bacterium]|nr:signal peptide peptidase SppA [Anaerolineales bacterium]
MSAKKLPRLYRARLRLGDTLRNSRLRLGNALKRRFRKKLPYLVFDLAGDLPEYAPPPPRWQRYLPMLGLPTASHPLSLADLRNAFDRIAADPRVPGVVLRVDHLQVRWATAQSLRGLLTTLRAAGKRVLIHSATDFDPLTYFVATAADEIYLAPPATWQVLGLRNEALFLKDALEIWGLQAEVIAITPYKTAGNMFSRASMSPEQREMLTWLLDGFYHALLTALAERRHLTLEQAQTLIDHAPLTAEEALTAGLLDAVIYLDELPARLSPPPTETPQDRAPAPPPDLTDLLLPYEEAQRTLLAPLRRRSGQMIALLSVEGTIVPGSSRDLPAPIPIPLVGDTQAGSETLARALRQIEDDPRIAALILHIDSPGGSALASDLIWREIERVRRKKPVVAYMGNTAASGGYYIAAPADWIVAQPLTVTGSIGVIFLKLLTTGLFSLFSVNRESIQRGARAGLFSDSLPLDEERRAVVEKTVLDTYTLFKTRVLAGRKALTPETLEPVAGGRVWLGQQALAHGLVDELGDLMRAVDKAKTLAHLPQDRWTPVVWVTGEKDGPSLPAPFPTASPAEWAKHIGNLTHEKIWLISPFEVKFR